MLCLFFYNAINISDQHGVVVDGQTITFSWSMWLQIRNVIFCTGRSVKACCIPFGWCYHGGMKSTDRSITLSQLLGSVLIWSNQETISGTEHTMGVATWLSLWPSTASLCELLSCASANLEVTQGCDSRHLLSTKYLTTGLFSQTPLGTEPCFVGLFL